MSLFSPALNKSDKLFYPIWVYYNCTCCCFFVIYRCVCVCVCVEGVEGVDGSWVLAHAPVASAPLIGKRVLKCQEKTAIFLPLRLDSPCSAPCPTRREKRHQSSSAFALFLSMLPLMVPWFLLSSFCPPPPNNKECFWVGFPWRAGYCLKLCCNFTNFSVNSLKMLRR